MTDRNMLFALALLVVAVPVGFVANHMAPAPPKLCIQVVGQEWAAKNKMTLESYIAQQRIWWDLPNASEDELNALWRKKMTENYAKDHSAAEAAQWFEAFRKAAKCG